MRLKRHLTSKLKNINISIVVSFYLIVLSFDSNLQYIYFELLSS